MNRSAAIASVGATVRGLLTAAREDAKRERYENAFDALATANSQLAAEERLSPGSSELAVLRRDWSAARTEVRAKCATTTDVNKGQALPLPVCK